MAVIHTHGESMRPTEVHRTLFDTESLATDRPLAFGEDLAAAAPPVEFLLHGAQALGQIEDDRDPRQVDS